MITRRTKAMVLSLLKAEQVRTHHRVAMFQRQSVLAADTVHPAVKAERIKAKRIGEAMAQIGAIPSTDGNPAVQA